MTAAADVAVISATVRAWTVPTVVDGKLERAVVPGSTMLDAVRRLAEARREAGKQ